MMWQTPPTPPAHVWQLECERSAQRSRERREQARSPHPLPRARELPAVALVTTLIVLGLWLMRGLVL